MKLSVVIPSCNEEGQIEETVRTLHSVLSNSKVVRFFKKLEEGYDCVFGSRFMKGGKVSLHCPLLPP